MSGFRNKTESDITAHRQEYLNNLDLEVQMNKIVEEAVTIQKQTGQPNPITQMRDTRTTTEKLADFEKLKIQLIKDLEPVADPQFAQLIIQKIVSSPLNVDGRLLVFTAQRIDELVKNISKIYKYGIKGDITDAEHFVQYIYKYYSDKNNLMLGAKSLMNRFGTTNPSGLISKIGVLNETIRRILVELNAKVENVSNIIRNGDLESSIRQTFSTIREYLTKISHIYPKDDNIIKYIEDYTLNFTGDELDRLQEGMDRYMQFINKNIPNTDFLYPLMEHLEITRQEIVKLNNTLKSIPAGRANSTKKVNFIREIDNAGNLFLSHLKGFLDQITGGENLSEIDYIVRLYDDIVQKLEREPVPPAFEGFTSPQFLKPNKQDLTWKPMTEYSEDDYYDDDDYDDYNDYDDDDYMGKASIVPPETPKNWSIIKKLPTTFEGRIERLGGKRDDMREARIKRLVKPSSRDIMDYENDEKIPEDLDSLRESKTDDTKPRGKGIRGCGLTKQEKFNKQIQEGMGIEPTPKFIKFGKYYLNQHLLNDNIFSLRSGRGIQVNNLPSYKMSKDLSQIVRKMIGGSNPSYEELNKLSESEKQYLYKVSKASKILDKVAIPTPSKDQEEKDIHRFNVLKGEIMAGNDSKDVIKEFKVLALKLSRNNIIPRRQINEVLEDLLAMGY